MEMTETADQGGPISRLELVKLRSVQDSPNHLANIEGVRLSSGMRPKRSSGSCAGGETGLKSSFCFGSMLRCLTISRTMPNASISFSASIRDPGFPSMQIRPPKIFGGDLFSGCCLDEWGAGKEDGSIPLHDD